jgi:MFS transporter, PPP family, 3-phenylpropionic acid transporter
MIEAFYFLYYQVVGVNMSFMPAHLRGLGLTGREISTVFTVAPVLSLAVPLAWAWIADRSHRHDRVLKIVLCGAWLGLTPVLWARSFAGVLAAYALFAVFSVGVSGLADALAVGRVRAGAKYGRMRVWGSAGFIASSVAVGGLFTFTDARADGMLAPLAMWLALGAAFAASLGLRGSGEAAVRPHLDDLKRLLGDPRLRWLLLAGALHWACMMPYNVYFGIFLGELGLTPLAWGMAFSVGVIAEMIVLIWFHHLQARFSLDRLLAAVFVVSALRWMLVTVVRAPWALIALQSLHGMTFGMFWSAAIALVAAVVPPALRATGQALLLVAINMGAIAGNLVTGRLFDTGGPRVMFLLAAAAQLAPLAVVIGARRRLRA